MAEDLGKAGVLALNQLSYQLPPDLSVAVSRSVTSQFFQTQAVAAGSSAVCIWNTGSSFVNPRQSFLILDVENKSRNTSGAQPVSAWFGAHGGSAANLINSMTILSRSGVVLEKIDRSNQLASIKALYQHDDGWREYGPGSAMGMATTNTLAWTGLPAGTGTIGGIVRFVIPLSHISPMFDSIETLLPAQLCSGLRFEIQFESAKTALVCGVGTDVPSYEIKQCRIQTESYLLSDLVMRSLSEQPASAGLEIVCKSAHNNFSSRASSSLTLDMGKSVSRALGFMMKERPSPAGLTAELSRFAAASLDAVSYVEEFQARVGSLYFPQQSIRAGPGGARGSSPELYVTALRAFGKFYQGNNISAGVSEKEYRTGSACSHKI